MISLFLDNNLPSCCQEQLSWKSRLAMSVELLQARVNTKRLNGVNESAQLYFQHIHHHVTQTRHSCADISCLHGACSS